MTELQRITIFVLDREESGPSKDFLWVEDWLARWQGKVHIADYSSGGWEHMWDVEGPHEAICEVPKDYLCQSEWTNTNR